MVNVSPPATCKPHPETCQDTVSQEKDHQHASESEISPHA